jgi:hypothetical protein
VAWKNPRLVILQTRAIKALPPIWQVSVDAFCPYRLCAKGDEIAIFAALQRQNRLAPEEKTTAKQFGLTPGCTMSEENRIGQGGDEFVPDNGHIRGGTAVLLGEW